MGKEDKHQRKKGHRQPVVMTSVDPPAAKPAPAEEEKRAVSTPPPQQAAAAVETAPTPAAPVEKAASSTPPRPSAPTASEGRSTPRPDGRGHRHQVVSSSADTTPVKPASAEKKHVHTASTPPPQVAEVKAASPAPRPPVPDAPAERRIQFVEPTAADFVSAPRWSPSNERSNHHARKEKPQKLFAFLVRLIVSLLLGIIVGRGSTLLLK
ncbi:hypothetical protein, conserved [Angomonas deanei]|uniref:Uncharacterized protein n=1 Tax=Angomonas deanei TaxID=59799 RepID=A0A7G2C2K4_9TRYP|nr:hypothetical protein, conserved [Angomonas deanei]